MANETMHNPQRREGESQKAYRERRAQSKRAADRILRGTRLIDPRSLGKAPSSTDRERARTKAERPAAPGPKFQRERAHKSRGQHFRDERGAYTLTGSVYSVDGLKPDEKREHVLSAGQEADGEPFYTARRKWLAGVSAQRGY
jgi:hypothetical protein